MQKDWYKIGHSCYNRLMIRNNPQSFICTLCSKKFNRTKADIRRGRIKYCSRECSFKNHKGSNNPSYKHGHAQRGKISPEWNTWRAMIDRCYVKSSSPYSKYGGRGIRVCDRWLGVDGFKNFLEDMGHKPSKHHSIDRIDGTKDYSPSNCRWATSIQQTNNQKSNRKVMWDGVEYNVSQLMRKLGVYTKAGTYYARLDRGWSVHDTFTKPIMRQ